MLNPNIGRTPHSDKPIRSLHLHSSSVTLSNFTAKMCGGVRPMFGLSIVGGEKVTVDFFFGKVS